MSRTLTLISCLPAMILSGCVTTGVPRSTGSNGAEPAILRGHVNIVRYYTRGEPKVSIAAIDNHATAAFSSNIRVPPGRRLVTVDLLALSMSSFSATVTWEFRPGRRYCVTARRAKHAFDLMLWDETDGKAGRTLCATSRVGGKFTNITSADSATVHGTKTDAFGHAPPGEAMVRITAINSQVTAARWGRSPVVHVAPGKCLVTVDISTLNGWRAAGTVELEFEAGKTYCLSAVQNNDRFDLMFWRELPEINTRALIATRHLHGWHSSGDGFLLFLLIH